MNTRVNRIGSTPMKAKKQIRLRTGLLALAFCMALLLCLVPAATMTATGYTFARWYTKDNKTVKFEDGTAAVDRALADAHNTITIYVEWTPNPYTITYSVDGTEYAKREAAYHTKTADITDRISNADIVVTAAGSR